MEESKNISHSVILTTKNAEELQSTLVHRSIQILNRMRKLKDELNTIRKTNRQIKWKLYILGLRNQTL